VLRKQDDEQDDADDQDDIQSDGGAMSVEAQVVLYHKMDLQPEEIAADMAKTDPTIAVRRVKAIIRKFQRNPGPLPADAVV